MKVGGESLNFLNLFTTFKRNSYIIFNWYHKPTFSGHFLNFYSQHLFIQKKDIIISLIDKVLLLSLSLLLLLLLSHPEFYKENFDFIIEVLLDNCYPLDLIFSTIKKD